MRVRSTSFPLTILPRGFAMPQPATTSYWEIHTKLRLRMAFPYNCCWRISLQSVSDKGNFVGIKQNSYRTSGLDMQYVNYKHILGAQTTKREQQNCASREEYGSGIFFIKAGRTANGSCDCISVRFTTYSIMRVISIHLLHIRARKHYIRGTYIEFPNTTKMPYLVWLLCLWLSINFSSAPIILFLLRTLMILAWRLIWGLVSILVFVYYLRIVTSSLTSNVYI